MDWLLYQLPWWVQAVVLLIVVGVPIFLLAAFLFGLKAAIRFVAGPVVAVIGLLAFASKLRQQGYNDRRAEEEKALDHAEDIAQEERDEAHRLPDVELDEKVDKWSRR